MTDFNDYVLRKWVLSCRLRDENTCFMCGRVGRIEVHHIYPKSLYPERAYNLDNGVSLCGMICHRGIVHAGDTFELTNWRVFVPMFRYRMRAKKIRAFNEKYQSRIWVADKIST